MAELITNKKGGYYIKGYGSRYSGLYFFFDDMYKICEFEGDCSFIMPNKNCIIIKNNGRLKINFDVRKSYDLREFGKMYKITEENGVQLIRFTKKTDSREDSSQDVKEFEIFIAIKAENHEVLDNWFEKHYPEDERRMSFPYSRWLYNYLDVEGKDIVVAVGETKNEALELCADCYVMMKKVIKETEKNIIKNPSKELTDAINSLYGLLNEKKLFAGLPWFFQVWSRDELICLKAFMLLEDYKLVKDILFRWLDAISEDGMLPNQYGHEKTNADGIGWLFKRIYDITLILNKKKLLSKFFTKNDKKHILEKLEHCLSALEKNHTEDELLVNAGKETWMDTKVGDSDRAGKRIEMQCFLLNMYRLMYFLEGESKFKRKETKLKKKVRETFFKDGILADGVGDFTVRPNIFLAYYIYQDLLAKDEWSKVFEKALPKLWLEWGGLATIDTSHPMFVPSHTGEDARSYHHGDSWFWINNYAAIAMKDIDAEKFKPLIEKIKEASKKDLMQGFVGHCSEVSSACEQRAEGCLCQAWSAASFIELFFYQNIS